ncbi:hypothetical protein [Streptomyces virginiae]|uniref:hypothetical protein n=1 Tax=Streptomyces virginiae TaxID=1961 RepID=UPI0022554762|nr:hypothetical protein [Streptomyces virginiae]MCX4958142.1 hypothetical protein [Streptomyces virginiae]MCX5176971.1 hypothetical protein [Streptomyces virginiae]
MSRTIKRSTKLATVAGMVTAISAAMFVTAPASQAAPMAAFRLSNFSATIANICVHTDIATQCSGNMAAGKSEVWKVAYKGPRKWYCTATAKGLTGTASTPYFSRDDVKECAEVGNIFGASIQLK